MESSEMILYSKNNTILITLHQSVAHSKYITLHRGVKKNGNFLPVPWTPCNFAANCRQSVKCDLLKVLQQIRIREQIW